jgi:hypothetical protein
MMRTSAAARRAATFAVVTLAVGVLAVIAAAAPASAHEGRHVDDLELVVGFGTEPAYTGQPNSVQVLLSHDGRPVTRLRDDLVVEVSFGDETKEYRLEPFFEVGEFGVPGDYRAWFVPSQPGRYTFHVMGTVEGEEVDETFTSGPQTFSPVQDVSDATFPEVRAPSNQELADRIEAEAARTRDLLASTVDAASRAADSAENVGLVALVLAAIATIASIGAFAAARRQGG